MQEKDILHESAHFWVCKVGNKFEINLHGDSCSYKVGEKFSLQNAIDFVAKMEKYPGNIKYLLP